MVEHGDIISFVPLRDLHYYLGHYSGHSRTALTVIEYNLLLPMMVSGHVYRVTNLAHVSMQERMDFIFTLIKFGVKLPIGDYQGIYSNGKTF